MIKEVYIAGIDKTIEANVPDSVYFIVWHYQGTIEHKCAIDSLAPVVYNERELDVFIMSIEQPAEYSRYYAANKRAILKEKLKDYKY